MGKDKWVMLAILLVVGAVGYQRFFSQSSEEPVYEKWSQAVAMRDCTTLEAMAEGPAKDWAENFCSQPAPAPANSQAAADQSADVNLPASAKEKALDVVRDLRSQTKNPDGTITLVAKETPLPIPGTLQKAAPPRMVTLRLKQEGDEWKVVDYQSQGI